MKAISTWVPSASIDRTLPTLEQKWMFSGEATEIWELLGFAVLLFLSHDGSYTFPYTGLVISTRWI
jgi:hypothetical protein